MLRATKIRIYPIAEQRIALSKQFGCVRWVFNYGLNLSQQTYKATGKGLNYYALATKLPKLKEEHEWLKEADSQALQMALQNLAAAYENFFKGRARFPRFRSKHGKQSYGYPQRARISERRENGWGTIYLPKVGHVRANIHREIAGKIKTITVSMDRSGRYWASLLADDGELLPAPSAEGQAVGVDVGLIHFATLSTGRKIANPRFLRRAEANLKRKQKKLSRKKKGSNSRNKARLKVARAHAKVARARTDFLHKESRRLVNENQVICFEDLNIRGMMANHKLAKAIGDVAWSTFIRFSSYKAEWDGKMVVKIHRFFKSSKTCNDCLYEMPSLPLNIRSWDCPKCGTHHDRDGNASNNIRDEGLRILWAEGYPAPASRGRVSLPVLAPEASPREAGSSVL
jgi:putative transposase